MRGAAATAAASGDSHDLSRRRACDTDTLIDLVLAIIFCFEFNSILKLRRVRIFMYRNCIY